MPNKRKKRSARILGNQASLYDDGPNMDKLPDIPRRFTQVLRAREIREKKHEQKEAKTSQPGHDNPNEGSLRGTKESVSFQRMNGKDLLKFRRRVDDKIGSNILRPIKEGTSTKIKKKRYLERLKQKQKKKKIEIEEDLKAKDFHSFQDHIKFGEVVQAPPSITAIPKQRRINEDQLLQNPSEFKLPGSNKKNQGKKQIISVASKRILEVERARVLEQYRAIKAKKDSHNFSIFGEK
ncbi:hypothetical protein G9A89_023741 [Geosiphon pyriformis]|nr:hypothetical protein G9A89_023741 [Geosiphon pyriformis]